MLNLIIIIILAGDFVKFGFTMASTTTILAWGYLSYKNAYEEASKFLPYFSLLQKYFIKIIIINNLIIFYQFLVQFVFMFYNRRMGKRIRLNPLGC